MLFSSSPFVSASLNLFRISSKRRISIFSKRATFSTYTTRMAQEYKLKELTSVSLQEGEKKEYEVEGIEGGKILLVKNQGSVHALSPNCTHYGAPLKNGIVSSDGRLTCPWHGACFNIASGDVEDAPALDPLAKFEIVEKDGAVYIKGDEATIKSGRKTLDIACKASGSEKVLVIGGGSATNGVIEELRKCGFKGHITVLSRETSRPFDRTKLSKALMSDLSKVAWRTPEFYKSASIDIIQEEATSIDFTSKTVSSKSGKSYTYTKLVLASGGHPKALPLPGLKDGELSNVFLLRSLSHTSAINEALGDSPKNVIVIGSSFIGMEVANCMASQKHNVTIVGMDKIPVANIFGDEVGKVCQTILEKNGVKFHMEAEVSHAETSSSDKSKAASLELKDGTSLKCDLIIEGVGVEPATQFLKESKGAPELEKDGGIEVDSHFLVKDYKDVYAVGDIAKYPYNGNSVRIEHWNVAQNAGRQVARSITGKPIKPFIPVFWSALGMQLRYCGNAAGYDDVYIDGSTDASGEKQPSFAAYYMKGEEVVAVLTMGKDPVMSQSAELMRRRDMLSKKEITGGKDVLQASL